MMLEHLTSFFANFGAYERGLSATMVILSMLGMGATLTFRDFADILVSWKGLAVGMAAQLFLIPAWAFLVIFVLSLVPEGFGGLTMAGAVGIATGLALLAAMPGGSLSNLMTFLGNGNVALSVTLTGITTFVCLFATPIVLAALVTVQVPGKFEIDTVQIMLDIGLFLILPLVTGMALRMVLDIPQQIRFTKIMVRAAFVLLAAIVIGSLGAGRLQFEPYGWLGPLFIVAFCVGSLYLARYTGKASGVEARDNFAITIEIVLKNGLLALLVITSMFPNAIIVDRAGPEAEILAAARDGCIFVVLFFSGTAMLAGFVTVLQSRKRLAAAT